MVYFDDILIYSTNLDVHLQHLREVLIVLRRDKFFADIAKCLFMTDSILFLGYVVSKDGLSVDESTVCQAMAITYYIAGGAEFPWVGVVLSGISFITSTLSWRQSWIRQHLK
jgi:nitrite reductase/ring-hydroxylating ferredoxin subunit